MLNLLPDYQKSRLAREKTFLIAHTAVGTVLIVVTISAMILTVARIILINQFNKIKHDTTLVNVEHLLLENNIDDLNKKIRRTDKIQQGFSKWSELLLNLNNLAPGGVAFNYLHLSRDTKIFRLNGRAVDRAALLNARAALEAWPLISRLEAPLSNLLEKNNIEFRFSGELKGNAFVVK